LNITRARRIGGVSAQAGKAALRGGHGGVDIGAALARATWPVTAPVAGLTGARVCSI
jgi:hypothetical protein